MLLGHVLNACGLLCSYYGLYGKQLGLMIFGSVLSGVTLMLQNPNFAALASETVPPQQRSQMATIQQQIASICNVLANVLGKCAFSAPMLFATIQQHRVLDGSYASLYGLMFNQIN